MNKILVGAVAGLVATVPMTILMLKWHQRLPTQERYPLPPREIFDELTRRAEISDELDENQKTNLSIAGHFAYGATTGAFYAPLISAIDKPNLINGAAYGVAVWAASYLGWLPAFRILKPATEHPTQRVMLMISAHLIWGATLGFITKKSI